MANLTITINADDLRHAQALLGVHPIAVPVVPEHLTEQTNDLLADLKAAEFELKDEKKAREDLFDDLKATERERDEARAAMLLADEARKDALDTAMANGETLVQIAKLTGFEPNGIIGGFVDHVRSLLERTAKALADADDETRRLRAEHEQQRLEIKRLQDLLGVDKAYPVRTVPTADKQPLDLDTEVWVGEPGKAEVGCVIAWRTNDDGSFGYRVQLGAGDPVWADEGDPDFHTERPKRKRRSRAEMDAEREALNTIEPGTVMLATIDGEQVQASVVRRFEGTTKYEVQVLRDGAGLAVVEAVDLAPLLDLAPEHEFKDEPVSDGANDDPLVNDEQYAEVKTAFQALGLSVAEVKAITRQHFGTESGRDLCVSQARQLVDVILPGSVNVPEALPF